mgnify:CR=1 FL=1
MEENYFNEFVKNVLKIPYCNFDGVSKKVQYEMIMGLSFIFERYPFFNHVLCALEQEKDFIYHYNMFIYTMACDSFYDDSKISNDKRVSGFYSITDDHELTGYYELPQVIDESFADYFSIVLFDGINDCDGRKIIFHEFGHLLDNFLHISNDSEFLRLVENKNVYELVSPYACINNQELVAEVFSKYILSLLGYEKDNNDFVMIIGKFIDEKYNSFVENNIDNNNYQFNLKYSICLKKKDVN